MKKTVVKLLIVSTIILLNSCGNQTKENHENSKTEKVEKTEEFIHTESGLSLDNGKLWKANQETTTGVNNMIELMNSFTNKDNVDAYGKLTENLKSEFTMIFEKCTMKGEAHNQLHNFLVPIKDLFEGLASNDLNKCKESYGKLNKHLSVYKNYFE